MKDKHPVPEPGSILDGFDPDIPVVAAHSGRRDDPETGASAPMHFAYTGIGDEAVTWQTHAMPDAVPADGIVLAFHAGLRKDMGAWSWFELRLGDRPLARFRNPTAASAAPQWDFAGGRLVFEPHYRDKNGDHYGRMLLTLAAEHVRSGQPLRLTVQGLEPEPPQPLDLVWRGRPGWESPRPFFMLLDRGDATRPRELELCVRTDAPVCAQWRGFGAQGDLFFRTRRLRELGVTDDDVRLIHDRIREMKPQLVRLCCQIREWEPELGKPDHHSEWLEDLCETLAVYKEAGSEVILTEWGHKLPDWCPSSSDPRNHRAPAPEMRREFARSWADLLYYLRRERGFTHVKYVILYNEPNGGGAPLTRQGHIEFADWAEIVRLLDGELRRLGLRGEVAVLGPDEVGTIGWLPRAVIELDNVLDHYCVHSYLFDNGAGFEDYLRECLWYLPRHHADGRQGLMITEFGMSGGGVWISPQNDTFANGLFLADVAVRAARLGIEAVLMWCLSDTNYGQAMKWGLWRFKDEDWKPRPGYFAWRLLTRYTDLGSHVFAVAASGDVAPAIPAVAFLSPAGRWTVLIVNTNPRPTPARLKNLPPDTCFTGYEYSPQTMTRDCEAAKTAANTRQSDAQGELQLVLPASSLTVLVDKDPNNQ